MAYINFSEVGSTTTPAARPTLSALEWSVVALAERDDPATLQTPGRVSIALGTLFGGRRNPQLADPRLEALRRIAVLTWRYGYVVPSAAIREFLTAGFTPDQYTLLADSIGTSRAKRGTRTVQ